MMLNIDEKTSEQVKIENVRMHDRDSTVYDWRHPYMRNKNLQSRFVGEVDFLEKCLSDKANIKALDCGAGTGNLSLKFLGKGWHVTSVDISSGMLSVLSRKAGDKTENHLFVESDIDKYLSEDVRLYDIVAFGATLHHLPDYLHTLSLACDRIAPGGVLYITGEPSKSESASCLERFLVRLDSIFNVFYKMLTSRKHFVGVLKKMLCMNDDKEVCESLAEFHADIGLDQDVCLAVIKENGLDVIKFERYGLFGFRITRLISFMLSLENKSQFTIVAQKRNG